MESIDGKPGISSAMLSAHSKKVEEDPNVYTNVAMTIDAMAIRQQITYDAKSQRMVGFVDLGMEENCEDEASGAFVVMVVGLTRHWRRLSRIS